MLDSLRPGQVILYRVDVTDRSSLAVAFALGNPFTHVSLVVEAGADPLLLNTYPGTDAVLIPASEMLPTREYMVLDHPDTEPSWRDRVASEGRKLVGSEYVLSPCSRLTALAFLKAGIDLWKPTTPVSWRERTGWVLPHELLTRTALWPVAAYPS
jgi:hypothetical protein